jgi:hypothetical protein
MMEAARTSETSVDIQLTTRQYIPEDYELHTRCRENLKAHESEDSHLMFITLMMETVSSSETVSTRLHGVIFTSVTYSRGSAVLHGVSLTTAG